MEGVGIVLSGLRPSCYEFTLPFRGARGPDTPSRWAQGASGRTKYRDCELPVQVPPTMLPNHLRIPEVLKTHPELIKRNLVLDQALNIVSMHNPARRPHHSHQHPRV